MPHGAEVSSESMEGDSKISEQSSGSPEAAEFDEFAGDYDAALNQGLELSGEGKEYFAAGRMRWLARLFERMGERPRTAVDFGCGTGTATPFFFKFLDIEMLTGTDPSEKSLETALGHWGDRHPETTFALSGNEPEAAADLVYCNGVFHHIPPAVRTGAIEQIARSLKPGGLFALWENNPWNPVTRYAMSRVPFDRDAVLVWPAQARRLMREGGFEVLRTDFVFFFPNLVRGLRGLEPSLCKVPFGGQYLVLGRKQ